MSNGDAKEDRRNGHNQTAALEPNELLVCDGCDGRGKHCDRWGPWECGLCRGHGYVTRSFWEAWVASFPPHVQAHIRRQPGPPLYRGNGHANEAPCLSLICE